MDVELRANLPKSLAEQQQGLKHIAWPVLVYWGISAFLGFLFLRDWIFSWNVGATLAEPWLIAILVVTVTIGQVIYSIIARHDGRPIPVWDTILFAVGNGIFETFAFALVYRLGEYVGTQAALLVAPTAAYGTGFVVGAIFFIIYGGGIHALFWLKILPPHLNDNPVSLIIRKYRLFSEIALVLGWCLCFRVTNDIWTVVFFHMIVDLGLMLRVRPRLFTRASSAT